MTNLHPSADLAYVYRDLKMAALWFEKVVPTVDEVEFQSVSVDELDFIMKNILPAPIGENADQRKDFIGRVFYDDDWGRLDSWGGIDNFLGPRDAVRYVREIFEKVNFDDTAACGFNFHFAYAEGRGYWAKEAERTFNAPTQGQNGKFWGSLSNIKIVDTKHITWSEILEIRRDPSATRKLRRLRLFAWDAYKDKPISYIQDDILKRIDDYEETVRSWRFKTVTQSINTLLSFKSLPAIAAGIAAHTLGSGVEASSLITAMFEFGNLSITLLDRHHDLNKLTRDSEISYLIDIKRAVEP